MDAWYQGASIMPAYWHCLSATPIGSLRLYAQIQSSERPRLAVWIISGSVDERLAIILVRRFGEVRAVRFRFISSTDFA